MRTLAVPLSKVKTHGEFIMREIFATLSVFGATAFAFGYLGPPLARAVANGRWSAGGQIYERSKHPVMYWLAILIFSSMVLTLTIASCLTITVWLQKAW